MKYIVFFLCLFSLGVGQAQQNLIPNGSFENYNQNVFDLLLDAQSNFNVDAMVTTHFHHSNTNASLFKCWKYEFASLGNSDGVGLLLGIVPDLYTTYGGTQYSDLFAIHYFEDSDSTDGRILSSGLNSQTVGLRLEQNVYNGLSGFDCSPPNTKFGSNVSAPDGSNYVALVDFKHNDLGGTQGFEASAPMISVKLKEPLVKDKEYTVVITRAQMNQLGVSANESNYETKNAELQLHVGMGDFSPKQEISQETFNNNDWETKSYTFVANKNFTHFRIRFNPIGWAGTGNKISGCFIDNLKLYETCETPQNQCNNKQYRCDMLDVKLNKVDRGDPLAYPDPDQNDKDFLKTIRAINLDNVKRFEMKIYTSGGSLIRTIDEWYPSYEYVWDGRNDAGAPMPEAGYTAIINAVSNDCFHNTGVDQKSFQLKRKYRLFENAQITNVQVNDTIGGFVLIPAITGLERVHNLNLKVYTVGGQSPVYEGNFTNPPNLLALSTQFGDPNGLPQLPNAQYIVEATLSNNCEPDYTFSNNVGFENNSSYAVSSPLFDWTPVSKPSSFTCPFNYSHQDNYLPPRDCCEGNLYISDVDIYNDFAVNIQNDIVFGNNVSFGSGSENYFYAGNDIIGEPGLEIPQGAVVELVAGQYNCQVCIQQPNAGIGGAEWGAEYRFESIQDSIMPDGRLSSGLYPNPTKVGSSFSVVLLQDVNTENYEVLVLDGLGKKVDIEIEQVAGKMIQLRLPENISDGLYHVKVHNGSMIQSFKLRITY